MILEWFIGFHKPTFRNANGQIDPRGWLGHCEIWGYTEDQTWLFIDPQGAGTRVRVMHRYDDVKDQLDARSMLCASILKIEGGDPDFSFPLHANLTCAALCGHLIGIRALVPATLSRKLRLKGAEVIHEAEGRPKG